MDLSKEYYKIREVSEMLDIPQSTLRYWEDEFECLNPIRTGSGRRHYTPKDIETVEIIRFLVHDKGMRIEAAKEQMRINAANVSRRVQMINTLKEAKEDLTAILKALEKRR